MAKPKLPDHLRKVALPIRVDPEVAEAAKAYGNASEWMNEAGREKLQREKAKRAKEARSKEAMKEGHE